MAHLTVKDIQLLLEHFENELYVQVRTEQRTDDAYIEDTFAVPEVKNPHSLYRSGIGRRMVEAPAEQLITSNPQVLIKTGSKEVTKHLQEAISGWIDVLRRQNPNPFKETVKNLLGRGEAYLQVVHNEHWVTDQKVRVGPPVLFMVPDAMVCMGSPMHDANGIPDTLFVKYERQIQDVIYKYPDWVKPGALPKSDEMIEWIEYWREGVRYFQADKKAVLETGKAFDGDDQFGMQENIYGFVPFVRRYSGFGRTATGNGERGGTGGLESLIVSDIKFARDLIREETATRSDLQSVMHLFAHRPINIILPDDTEVDIETIAESISLGAYDVNVLKLPEGSKFEDFDVLAPTAEMFQHHRDIMAEIRERNPFISPGPSGSSGRQQDLTASSARRRYATVVENVETMWATGFEMALRIIAKVPTLAEQVGLRKEDINRDDVEITVRLMEDDPVEADRLATLGSRLWNMGQGEIDLRTNLIEYQGKSPENAEEIIVNKLVDNVTIFGAEWAQVVGLEFAREAGLMDQIEEARQLQADQTQSQGALKDIPPTTTQRVQGETQTPTGFQMIDSSLTSRGARKPPERFKRNA